MDSHDLPSERDPALWVEVAAALALAALLAGLTIGATSPLAMFAIAAGPVAGPTWAGLALLAAAGLAVVTGLLALFFRSGRWWDVPVAAGSAALVLGILLGSRLVSAHG